MKLHKAASSWFINVIVKVKVTPKQAFVAVRGPGG
jgi:hypothetical protein